MFDVTNIRSKERMRNVDLELKFDQVRRNSKDKPIELLHLPPSRSADSDYENKGFFTGQTNLKLEKSFKNKNRKVWSYNEYLMKNLTVSSNLTCQLN